MQIPKKKTHLSSLVRSHVIMWQWQSQYQSSKDFSLFVCHFLSQLLRLIWPWRESTNMITGMKKEGRRWKRRKDSNLCPFPSFLPSEAPSTRKGECCNLKSYSELWLLYRVGNASLQSLNKFSNLNNSKPFTYHLCMYVCIYVSIYLLSIRLA